MRLDRNVSGDGRGKYGIVRARRLQELIEAAPPAAAETIKKAISSLEEHGILDWGTTPETEFFVLLLKDRFARPALAAYAQSAALFTGADLLEYAGDINKLSERAGKHNPACKTPD